MFMRMTLIKGCPDPVLQPGFLSYQAEKWFYQGNKSSLFFTYVIIKKCLNSDKENIALIRKKPRTEPEILGKCRLHSKTGKQKLCSECLSDEVTVFYT